MKSFQDLRIIFIGTPEFAVASLDALCQAGANVVAVITASDKPSGRGLQMNESAVKKYAIEKELKILQPPKLKNPDFLQELESLHADLQIVVAFRMLPEAVWNMPPLGTINVHGSLLPDYRGAAPINWAIINGETTTGVTTFRLKHEIDTGNILLQKKLAILPEDNVGTLYEKLMQEGAKLLVETVKGIAEETITPQPQQISEHTKHAPKIFKEDCIIHWNQSVESIHNFIRGLSPYPAAFTQLNGKQLKVFKTSYTTEMHDKIPGDFDTDHKTYLRFAGKDGWVYLENIQLEGKKKMSVEDFLKGFRG